MAGGTAGTTHATSGSHTDGDPTEAPLRAPCAAHPHAPRLSLARCRLQVETAVGGAARYVTSASSYLVYYAAALLSARERAPDLRPVLALRGALPPAYRRWLEGMVRGRGAVPAAGIFLWALGFSSYLIFCL